MVAYQVAIIGAGSHGKDIEHIWANKHPLWPMKMFDDKRETMIGLEAALHEYGSTYHWYIGVNDSQTRALLSEVIDIATGLHAMPLVHNAAVLDDRCDFARGVVIGANTTLTWACRLGKHTHVNYNVGMTRTTCGDFVTIGPGVTIAGDVQIGDRTMIGAGATVCDRVTIGSDVVIGAGAVVLPETVVPDGETWVGVPARKK